MDEIQLRGLLQNLPNDILLDTNGNIYGWEKKNITEPDFNFNISNINRAIKIIPLFFEKTTSYYTKRSSYGFKHSLEYIRNCLYKNEDYYICNGDFIVACIYLGYKIKPINDNSINVFLNMKLKDKVFSYDIMHKYEGFIEEFMENLTEEIKRDNNEFIECLSTLCFNKSKNTIITKTDINIPIKIICCMLQKDNNYKEITNKVYEAFREKFKAYNRKYKK